MQHLHPKARPLVAATRAVYRPTRVSAIPHVPWKEDAVKEDAVKEDAVKENQMGAPAHQRLVEILYSVC
jgi:hypothetical protein